MSTINPNELFDELITGSWQLDPQRSSVEFRARHVWGLGKVKGRFDRYEGQLDLRATPAIELTIDSASLRTGNRKRDRHLRSDDFFDADNHPQVRFLSESVHPRGDTLKVRGRLSAGGGSIPLELDASVRREGGELRLEAATTAQHRELGMTYSPLGMIPPQSELLIKGYLVRDTNGATGPPA
jgi:polyisoprenoid-binding protein YceI